MKIRPTSRDVTVIENSQESNKPVKSVVNVSVQNLSNSSSVELFAEIDCADTKTEEVTNKDYKRESLDRSNIILVYEEVGRYVYFLQWCNQLKIAMNGVWKSSKYYRND